MGVAILQFAVFLLQVKSLGPIPGANTDVEKVKKYITKMKADGRYHEDIYSILV